VTTEVLDRALEETLSTMETALLAPVVSGELKSWINNVQQAVKTFAVDWTRHLHSVLHVQYAEIATSDPEMSAFVEKMIKTDQELLEELAQFHEALHQLSQRANEVNRDEGKLAGERQAVEDAGIALILKIKKQRTAAATWLAESAYRDRGVVD
jgi:hypothetical protein